MTKVLDNLAYLVSLFFQKVDHLGVELISGVWSVIIGLLTVTGYLSFNSIDFVYVKLGLSETFAVYYGEIGWGTLSIFVGAIQIYAVFNQISKMTKKKTNGTHFFVTTITRQRVYAALLSGIYFGISAVAYAYEFWCSGVWVGMGLMAIADLFIFIRLSTIKKYV